MENKPKFEPTHYSIEELILFAGASYQSITNAIDNGEVESLEDHLEKPL